MIPHPLSRRSLLGLLGVAPLAAPAALKAAGGPATAGLRGVEVDTSALDEMIQRAAAARQVLNSISPTASRLALRLSCLEGDGVSSPHPEAS